MAVGELLGGLVEWVGSMIGLNGLAVTALVVSSIGLFYLHEAADAFAALSRWARMLSYVGIALAVTLVATLHFGIIDLSTGGSVIGQLAELIGLTI